MYEIDKEKFGAFVAQLRKEQGMTQKELAQEAQTGGGIVCGEPGDGGAGTAGVVGGQET